MNFVLDCSVTMAWLFGDQSDRYTERILESLGRGDAALVPILWSYEISNALMTGERRKLVSPSQSARFLELLRELSISFHPLHDVRQEDALIAKARSFGLTSYDASYLALAMSRGLPLATRDKALVHACGKAGVSVYRPS